MVGGVPGEVLVGELEVVVGAEEHVAGGRTEAGVEGRGAPLVLGEHERADREVARQARHDLLRPVDVAVDDHDGLPVGMRLARAATPAAAAAGCAPPRVGTTTDTVVTTPPGRG